MTGAGERRELFRSSSAHTAHRARGGAQSLKWFALSMATPRRPHPSEMEMVRLVSFQRRIASGSLRHPRRLPSRTGAPSARNGLRPRLVWIRRVEVDADLVVHVVLQHSRRTVSHVLSVVMYSWFVVRLIVRPDIRHNGARVAQHRVPPVRWQVEDISRS